MREITITNHSSVAKVLTEFDSAGRMRLVSCFCILQGSASYLIWRTLTALSFGMQTTIKFRQSAGRNWPHAHVAASTQPERYTRLIAEILPLVLDKRWAQTRARLIALRELINTPPFHPGTAMVQQAANAINHSLATLYLSSRNC